MRLPLLFFFLLAGISASAQLQQITTTSPGSTARQAYTISNENDVYLDGKINNVGDSVGVVKSGELPTNVNSMRSNVDVVGPGTVTLTNGSAAVTGTGTNFTDATAQGVGFWFSFHVTDATGTNYYVFLSSITNATTATISFVYTDTQLKTAGSIASTTFPGTTGTYGYKVVRNKSRGNFANSLGNNSYAENFATAFGGLTVASGQTSFAMGAQTLATGSRAFAGGWGSFSNNLDKRVLAAGQASFNFSQNFSTQTVGHGALALGSAILGGKDHNIPSNSTNSAILGGDGIKVSSAVTNTAHFPKIRFGLGNGAALTTDNTNTSILTRDATTGEIEIRDASTLGGGGSSWNTSGNTNITAGTTVTLASNDPTSALDFKWLDATNGTNYFQRFITQNEDFFSGLGPSVTFGSDNENGGPLLLKATHQPEGSIWFDDLTYITKKYADDRAFDATAAAGNGIDANGAALDLGGTTTKNTEFGPSTNGTQNFLIGTPFTNEYANIYGRSRRIIFFANDAGLGSNSTDNFMVSGNTGMLLGMAGNSYMQLRSNSTGFSVLDRQGTPTRVLSFSSSGLNITHGTTLSDMTSLYLDNDEFRVAVGGGANRIAASTTGVTLSGTVAISSAPTTDNAETKLLVRDATTGNIEMRDASSLGGGGITNSAAANEVMKSDGTNAVGSSLYSTGGNVFQFGNSATSQSVTLQNGTATSGDFRIQHSATIGAMVIESTTSSVNITASGALNLTSGTLPISATHNPSSTNTIATAFTARRTSTGTPATGIGARLQFGVEANASASSESAASIDAVSTAVAEGTESFDMAFNTMNAGAAQAEKFRIRSTGAIAITTTPVTDNTEDLVLVRDATTGNIEGRSAATIGGAGGVAWGDITGTLSAQTDLQSALDAKADDSEITTINNTLAALPTFLSASATLDFASTGATAVSTLTISVPGAVVGNPCTVGAPAGSVTATASYWCWVSAADVVSVRLDTNATENPASGTFTVVVTQP